MFVFCVYFCLFHPLSMRHFLSVPDMLMPQLIRSKDLAIKGDPDPETETEPRTQTSSRDKYKQMIKTR